MILLCWCFHLELVAVIACAVVLEVGSSTLVAWPCFHHRFDLSDTRYWGVEFLSAIGSACAYSALIL